MNNNLLFPVFLVAGGQLAFQGDVRRAKFVAQDGHLEILAHHCPLVTCIEPGPVLLDQAQAPLLFCVGAGVAHVNQGIVSIFVAQASLWENDSEHQLEQYINELEQRLKEKDFSPEDQNVVQQRLNLSTQQLHLMKQATASMSYNR